MPATEHRVSLPARYSVVRHLADGGMASVWVAEDEVLGRLVAVKVLSPAYAHDERAVRRFAREARAGARLSDHPHVVTVFDVGEEDGRSGRPFMVMEYLAGGTLADRLRSGRPIPRALALRWLREAASALDAAHALDVVHRDVKPANLLLDERGRLAVGDFGIATVASEGSVTQTGQVLGTAAYLSPEQALGKPATAASDRYALAIVAFELLTGRRPFKADHVAGQARAHVEATVPDASAVASGLPRDVDRVLERGMSKDPEARPASASELVGRLERALGDPPVLPPTEQTRPLPAAAPGPRRPPTSPAAAARAASPRRPPTSPAAAGPAASPRRRGAWLVPVALLVAAAAVVGLVALGDGGGEGASREGRSGPERGATADRSVAAARRRSAATEERAAARRPAPSSKQAAPPATTQESPSPRPSENPVALNDQGFDRIRVGDYGTAVPLLQRSVGAFRAQGRRGEMAYAFALFNLGQALSRSGRPAEAVPYLEERLKVSDFKRDVVKAELKVARAAAKD
jgi:eukaryotic-like serine/threonine-protein kinase